jgi:hypothetical protein
MNSVLRGRIFFEDLPATSLEPIEVLTLARANGAQWKEEMCIDAAFYDNLELLQWLRSNGCQWDAVDVADRAVRGYSIDVLKWVFEVVSEWQQEDKDYLLFEAGCWTQYVDFEVAEFLLQQGALWPTSYMGISKYAHKANCKKPVLYWHEEALEWAIEKHGRSWGVGWKCEQLAPEHYDNEQDIEFAQGTFEWAHAHGCPCTCAGAATAAATAAAAAVPAVAAAAM